MSDGGRSPSSAIEGRRPTGCALIFLRSPSTPVPRADRGLLRLHVAVAEHLVAGLRVENSAIKSRPVNTRSDHVRRNVPSSSGSTTSSGACAGQRRAPGNRRGSRDRRHPATASASRSVEQHVVDRPDRTPRRRRRAERWRTICAPKTRASPTYWSKRSWTRPSIIVSSRLATEPQRALALERGNPAIPVAPRRRRWPW